MSKPARPKKGVMGGLTHFINDIAFVFTSLGPCRPGSFHSDRDGLCQKCPVHTYTNVTGSKGCLKCQEGTVTLAEGSNECETRKLVLFL